MKYYLSIEFENQGEPTNYKVGDIITFVSLRGYLKNGVIKEIRYSEDMPVQIPLEYKVDCNGKEFLAVADYVLKTNARVLNVGSRVEEIDAGFPLRT